MSTLARKLRRDLKASWGRFAMMIAAIAVTLTAVGAVLFAWSASARETRTAYMSTEPASATILFDQAVVGTRMEAIVDEVRERPGVLDAAARTQFTSDVSINGRLSDFPLQVFVAPLEDPMTMARFFPQDRTWPPATDEILVGQDSLALLGISIGDTLEIAVRSGNTVDVTVVDSVYDPSLSPSPQEQTGRAYLSAAALVGPGGEVALDQLKIQVAEAGADVPTRERDRAVKVAGDVTRWLQREYDVRVREIQVPTPYAHPHQWQADTLLGSLLGGGAAALVLSTVLVANMLNNLFLQQIPQIGIMKAIGGRSSRIARMYLAMAFVVALGATMVALFPAIALGRVAVGNFLGFLGIQPRDLDPPAWTYFVVIGLGLGLPTLMTLLPVTKASRTTVRAAIDHRGLGSKRMRAMGFLTRVGSMKSIDRGLLMAFRNTVRRPTRFFLSVGLLAAAGMVFVAGMSLSTGVEAVTEEQKQDRTWDVDVQLGKPAPPAEVEAAVRQVADVTGVETFNVAPTGLAGPGEVPVTRTYPDQGHGRVTVTALPDDPTTFDRPEMLDGRWLRPDEIGGVVLNQMTRKNTVPDIEVGEDVQLIVGGEPTTWRVVGLAQERQSHGGGVYATAEGFAAATGQPELVNQLRVFTDQHDEQTRETVAEAAEAELTNAGFEVTSAASISRSEAISEGHLGPVVLILLGIAIPLGVVGVIGLASTMSANVLDRIREFGVMHAIGARPKAVRRVVVAEGMILAFTSVVVAILPAVVLTALLGAGLGNLFFSAPLPFRMSLLAIVIWLVLVLLGSVLATDAAATRASRLTVREAIAYL